MRPVCLLLFFSAVIAITNASCIPGSRYALNRKETDYIGKSNRFHTISILYDNKAIRKLRSDGVYTVKISETDGAGTLCSMDTSVIKAKALMVARTVSRFMNFRVHYEYIDVEFGSTVKNGRKNMLGEEVGCSYTIRMPLHSLSYARVVSSNNGHDANSLSRQ